MDCTQVSELISMYIEGEVSAEIHTEMSQHLEQCTPCRLLKEKVEELLYAFPALEEEVPFFLKNRLYYIPESQQIEELPESKFFYLKWVAAAIGPLILFLNLFYFTNINPPANRFLHNMVSKIETLTVEVGAFFTRLKESKTILGFSSEKRDTHDNQYGKKYDKKAPEQKKTHTKIEKTAGKTKISSVKDSASQKTAAETGVSHKIPPATPLSSEEKKEKTKLIE